MHAVQDQLSDIYTAGGASRKVFASAAAQAPAFQALSQHYKRPPSAAATPPAKPRSAMPSGLADPKIARMVAERDARSREMTAFYADPEYTAMLNGASDDQLSPAFLLHRRRLFGKRRPRRR